MQHVSILARSGDRALQYTINSRDFFKSFQSSPGLVTGRYGVAVNEASVFQSVSILARSGDRALPTTGKVTAGSLWFQSSPGLVTGRYPP